MRRGNWCNAAVLDSAGRYPGTTIHAALQVIAPVALPYVKIDLDALFAVLGRAGLSRPRCYSCLA